MQLTQESKKVVRSSQFAESKFKIEASSKAFQILSSRLYADGIKAIVRELCTNASDAHTAAGISDQPIQVHCPNLFDGSFSVRDFGNGIDPEDFEKIYTTYFYSTKSDTNDQVGCFGLGSKSPFAYTQQFTVENNFNGKKYIYSCFINESGEPSVTLLSEISTEESGVKISFPVKREDWYSFEDAAKKVLQWFDVSPKTNVAFDNCSFSELRDNFRYGDAYDIPTYGIRMGQVVYPVKSEYFSDYLDTGTIINVNIGDVDITPSRESLEYSKRTCETLDKLVQVFSAEFNNEMQSIMDSDKSEYGKFVEMMSRFTISGIVPTLRARTLSKHFPNRPNGSYNVFEKIDNNIYDGKLIQVTKTSWKDRLEREKDYISITGDSVLLVKDKGRDINEKMMQIIKSKTISSNRGSVNIILIPLDKKDLFLKTHNLREEDLTFASKCVLDAGSQSSVRVSNNCSKLQVNSRGECSKVGAKITKDDKTGYYVPEDYISGLIKYRSYNLKYFANFLEEKEVSELFIFTESQYDHLKINQRKFTNFLDVIVSEIKNQKDDIVNSVALDSIVDSNWHNRSLMIGEKTTTDNFFKKHYNFFQSQTAFTEKAGYYLGLVSLIQHHKIDLYSEIYNAVKVKKNELTENLSEAKKKFPLAKILLDNNQFDDIIDSVVEYVDMMETKGE